MVLRNSKGEEVILDRIEMRYRRIGQGFLNSLRLKPYFVKHITLTQKEENYKPNILNNFFNSLRRFYDDILYIWTAELQERGVLHWHVIVGFPWDIQFGREDVQRIQKYWKYGNVDISPVRKPSMSYLLKYITKSILVGLNIRRIGGSRVAGWLRQSWKRVVRILEVFTKCGGDPNQFYWFNGNAYVLDEYNRRVRVYSRPPSGWFFVQWLSDEEPF